MSERFIGQGNPGNPSLDTLESLTAENAVLTQRVADLREVVTANDELLRKSVIERDAAIAEAGRLREIAGRVIEAHELPDEPGIDMNLFRQREREIARERLAATTPAAASERRVAEQRVIEAARKARGFDKRSMLNHTMENYRDESEAIWAIYTEVDALAALDAPGGGA